MQLNLFQWDIIAVGKGYQGLADLDLDAARDHFSRVLAARPGHPSACQGLRDVQVWEEVLRKLEGMAPEAALGFLWGRIAGFPFGDSEHRRNLRAALIRRLLAMMGDRADFFLPPDLCRGCLHLQLADYAAAERELRHLLARFPENGRLHGYLGDALWQQGRRSSANEAYARGLLLAPHEVAVDGLCHRGLAEMIEEYGPAMAPIYGFFAEMLPLVALGAPARTREAQSCELLRQAEQARARGDHEGSVTVRRRLKELSPEVLQDYLAWLAR
jgi:tetratricopeptide (TPR) repeat protein